MKFLLNFLLKTAAGKIILQTIVSAVISLVKKKSLQKLKERPQYHLLVESVLIDVEKEVNNEIEIIL